MAYYSLMKVCIAAGHGGADPGGIGRDPYLLEEKVFDLALAERLEEELEHRGHWTIMTRRRDRTLSLAARASFANRLQAEFFISVHANAAASAAAEGMELYHFPASAAGSSAASHIHAALAAAFPDHRMRGVKEANFAVLRLTRMPAVLVECEFITHPVQLAFLDDVASQIALAVALADGIDKIEAILV